MKRKYSIVIPVYNSEMILPQTIERTVNFFNANKLDYELILVSDNSPDDSWGVIEAYAAENRNIKGINLLKNYGQHTAIYAGFEHAKGDYVVTMDDDLQNPPEEITHLINEVEKGYDMVIGKFLEKKHSFYRRIGSRFVGYLNKK